MVDVQPRCTSDSVTRICEAEDLEWMQVAKPKPKRRAARARADSEENT